MVLAEIITEGMQVQLNDFLTEVTILQVGVLFIRDFVSSYDVDRLVS